MQCIVYPGRDRASSRADWKLGFHVSKKREQLLTIATTLAHWDEDRRLTSILILTF